MRNINTRRLGRHFVVYHEKVVLNRTGEVVREMRLTKPGKEVTDCTVKTTEVEVTRPGFVKVQRSSTGSSLICSRSPQKRFHIVGHRVLSRR